MFSKLECSSWSRDRKKGLPKNQVHFGLVIIGVNSNGEGNRVSNEKLKLLVKVLDRNNNFARVKMGFRTRMIEENNKLGKKLKNKIIAQRVGDKHKWKEWNG